MTNGAPSEVIELRREIPLFPLNTVLFPGAKLPLHIFEDRYKLMLQQCLEGDWPLGVVLIRKGQEVGGPVEPFDVGTLARIIHVDPLPDGQMKILVRGEQRFRIVELVREEPYPIGRVELLPNRFIAVSPSLTRVANRLSALLYRYIELREIADKLALADMMLPTDIASLCFRIGALLEVPLREKQALLEAEDLNDLLSRELEILDREVRRLQRTAFWHQFLREWVADRALPPERAIWN